MSDKAKERSLALRALKHCMGEIWQNKKIYFVFSALNVIFSALQPFANILLMPMLIDTLINDRDFKKGRFDKLSCKLYDHTSGKIRGLFS